MKSLNFKNFPHQEMNLKKLISDILNLIIKNEFFENLKYILMN